MTVSNTQILSEFVVCVKTILTALSPDRGHAAPWTMLQQIGIIKFIASAPKEPRQVQDHVKFLL